MSTTIYGMMAALLLAGAAHAAEQPRGVNVLLTSPQGVSATVLAEVASTDAERQQGLMNRKSLGANAGMLFVWPAPERVSFWMKNTYLPLDLLFIANGYVVAVAPHARPLDETPISPPLPVNMVLEVNAGWAAAHRLGVGWGVSVTLK